MGKLGPIKSMSLRVASRLSRALRAGRPVECWQAFSETSAILIAVPDSILEHQLNELREHVSNWRGKLILLCESARDSSVLEPFRELGAAAVSINSFEAGRDWIYFVEGDRAGVRLTKALLGLERWRVQEIRAEAKPFLRAGITLSLDSVVPLAAGARRCLRLAGVSGLAAERLIERFVMEGLRRGGRAGFRATKPKSNGHHVDAERIGQEDPKLAGLYLRSLRLQAEPEEWTLARGA
jgi:hypothetical protein